MCVCVCAIVHVAWNVSQLLPFRGGVRARSPWQDDRSEAVRLQSVPFHDDIVIPTLCKNSDRMPGKNSSLSNAKPPFHRPAGKVFSHLVPAYNIFVTHFLESFQIVKHSSLGSIETFQLPILNPSSPKPVARNVPC